MADFSKIVESFRITPVFSGAFVKITNTLKILPKTFPAPATDFLEMGGFLSLYRGHLSFVLWGLVKTVQKNDSFLCGAPRPAAPFDNSPPSSYNKQEQFPAFLPV